LRISCEDRREIKSLIKYIARFYSNTSDVNVLPLWHMSPVRSAVHFVVCPMTVPQHLSKRVFKWLRC